MELAGKTILLTGGTDGIGKQLALQLRDAGALVIVTGRNEARVAASTAAGFTTITADLSAPDGADQLLSALGSQPIDILINNAGSGSDYEIDRPDLLDDADRCITLNLNAPIHLVTRLMAMLKSRPEAMIVNVTSGLAIAPRAGGPIYCATKAALRSYTLALRHQLQDSRIHVLEVLPPVVETKMTAGRSSGKMPAAQCARQMVGAMRRNANEANVGMVKILRLLYSLSPALARKVMIRF